MRDDIEPPAQLVEAVAILELPHDFPSLNDKHRTGYHNPRTGPLGTECPACKFLAEMKTESSHDRPAASSS